MTVWSASLISAAICMPGLMMGRKRDANQFIACITKLIRDPKYKQATQAFSVKYTHCSDDEAINRTTLKVE